jgi:rhodanese-related sulfurtransferase
VARSGYAGDVAPAAALDLLVNDPSVVLVDLRTAKEKEGSGIPDLPSAAASKCLEVEYAVTEDKRLRGQLRDVSAIEAQVTALQVAALKKIGKGTKVILLDRYGPAAATVARELNAKGYSKVFVISGGFDGRGGWVQSKLQIKPAATLSSAAPPLLAKTVFTRRALPAPKA